MAPIYQVTRGGISLNQSTDRGFYLFDMSWPEVKDALKTVRAAIIPTGSAEQHGPNGTFEVDTARAREFSIRLGKRLYPKVIVTPPIQFGVSGHHIRFPGTLTLRPDTFVQVCMDIAWSLYQHGIRKLVFVNGHGGNRPSLSTVVSRIKYELGADAAWVSPTAVVQDVIKRNVTSPITGHACESEMSQCLYLWPQSVKTNALEKGDIYPHIFESWGKFPIEHGRYWDEISRNGALGDATKSSYELGKEAIETALDRLAEYLTGFIGDD